VSDVRPPTDGSGLAPVLTVPEAAHYLRISRGSAYEAIRTGELPQPRPATARAPVHSQSGYIAEHWPTLRRHA